MAKAKEFIKGYKVDINKKGVIMVRLSNKTFTLKNAKNIPLYNTNIITEIKHLCKDYLTNPLDKLAYSLTQFDNDYDAKCDHNRRMNYYENMFKACELQISRNDRKVIDVLDCQLVGCELYRS